MVGAVEFRRVKDPEGMQRWLDEYDRIARRKMHLDNALAAREHDSKKK